MQNWASKKILIVEDELYNFMYIKIILAQTNIQIVYASNGKKALEVFKNDRFDFILMDIKMPEMDGFEATGEIRKLDHDIVIVAQTAYAYKREEAITKGFTDYISKPFSQQQLLMVIQKYM